MRNGGGPRSPPPPNKAFQKVANFRALLLNLKVRPQQEEKTFSSPQLSTSQTEPSRVFNDGAPPPPAPPLPPVPGERKRKKNNNKRIFLETNCSQVIVFYAAVVTNTRTGPAAAGGGFDGGGLGRISNKKTDFKKKIKTNKNLLVSWATVQKAFAASKSQSSGAGEAEPAPPAGPPGICFFKKN